MTGRIKTCNEKRRKIIKEIQNKILALVISSIFISALVIMVTAFWGYNRLVENDTSQIMQLICSEKRQAIDEKLMNIEQSVYTIYHFAMEQIGNTENIWRDEERYNEHISRMKALMKTTAQYTDGAVSVYYRLAPNIKGPKQGAWLMKNENAEFVECEVTDISQYDSGDVEHVGWYYQPIANGKETWINPYYNKNVNLEMISFVIPIFQGDTIIGVVGMDITTELLYENAKSVTVYDTGYAFLLDNEGNFVYHPEMKSNKISVSFNKEHNYLYEKSMLSAENRTVEKYRWNDMNKRLTTQSLNNGMLFTVCITEDEIMQSQQLMIMRSVVVILLIISVFILVTVMLTKEIVKLAYTDVLTGLGNKTAYRECTDNLNRQIISGENVKFAVAVMDINNLKKINDSYGHEYGDILIQNAASVLKKVWSKDSYRIGGDEFAVVLLNADSAKMKKDILLFEAEMETFRKKNSGEEYYLQMAVGAAVYDSETDREYADVFRRADSAMYEDKKEKKSRVK